MIIIIVANIYLFIIPVSENPRVFCIPVPNVILLEPLTNLNAIYDKPTKRHRNILAAYVASQLNANK